MGKGTAAKPEDLSLISSAHTVEGELCPFISTFTLWQVPWPTLICRQNKSQKEKVVMLNCDVQYVTDIKYTFS